MTSSRSSAVRRPRCSTRGGPSPLDGPRGPLLPVVQLDAASAASASRSRSDARQILARRASSRIAMTAFDRRVRCQPSSCPAAPSTRSARSAAAGARRTRRRVRPTGSSSHDAFGLDAEHRRANSAAVRATAPALPANSNSTPSAPAVFMSSSRPLPSARRTLPLRRRAASRCAASALDRPP